MLMAASMGAAAFQKGLGMIHSMAHPLSSECGLHHGLANALALPTCIEFLEKSNLKPEQRQRLENVLTLFRARNLAKENLSTSCKDFFAKLGLQFGLANHGVKKENIETLSHKAFLDPCHGSNMIPVTEADFRNCFNKAL
jgi:alcohol dehydrogenase class IV